MTLIAGIDEAGYGPVLGPLVVSGAALRVPPEKADTCLWELLTQSVTAKASKRDHRLPILDSKKLYNRKTGLANLERSVLTALRLRDQEPVSFRDLLTGVAQGVLSSMDEYPWYASFDAALPLEADATGVGLLANAVRKDMKNQGIELASLISEPLPAGHYNRLVEKTRNKSSASFSLVMRIVDHWLRKGGDPELRVYIDRQGGRTHYGQNLMTAFDRFDLQILEETDERSRYVLRGEGKTLAITFTLKGEEKYMPIAMASILSKYLREVFMLALNRFWQQKQEDLKPTAGYYTDGHRFLRDIANVLNASGIDRNLLVRTR